MSRWRSVNPSSFTPKGNALGALAKGFADVWVPATMKQAELDEKRKYEEEQERKKKAAAAAAAAAKQNEKDKKLARNAKILALQYSGTDKNTDAIVYFTQQLQLMDGDIGGVITSTEGMLNRGQIEFTTETQTESLPMQGPDVPRNYPLTVAPDGKEPITEFKNSGEQITAGNVGSFKSTGTDESGEEKNAYKRTGDQMAQIFEPVSEEPPVDVERTTYGIERTPYGQVPDKLDVSQLKTLEDIDLYEMQIEAGSIKLSDDDKKLIDERKAELQGRAVGSSIQQAYTSAEYTRGRLADLGRTDEGRKSEEYVQLSSIDAWHKGQAPKPYSKLIEPEAVASAANANELERRIRTAVSTGASEDEVAFMRTELVARRQQERSTPIEWSKANDETGAELLAKELEQSGRPEDAQSVRDWSKGYFTEEPLSTVELSKLSLVALAALENSVKDADYLTRIKAARSAVSDASFSIKDYDNVELDTLIIERDNALTEAPESSRYAQLDALVKAREAEASGTMPALNMDGGFFVTSYKYTDEFGTESVFIGTTAPSDKGWYDLDNRRIIPANSIVSNRSMKMLGEQASLYTQANDTAFVPIKKGRNSTATMLESARRLEQFVNPAMGGNPAILTTVGGDVTRLIERLSNEYDALNELVLQGKSTEEVYAYIDNQMSGLSETASLASQFQAELLKFAYTFASSALEQRGTGLSNTDFKQALNIVSTGSTYSTFSNNLRSQAIQRISTVDNEITTLKEDDGYVYLLNQLDPNLTQGYIKPMEQWLGERGLGDMYVWANGKAEEVANNDTTPPPVVQNQTVGTSLSTFKNDPLYPEIKDQLGRVTDPDRLARALDIYSKRFNVPVDVLKKEFGITQ